MRRATLAPWDGADRRPAGTGSSACPDTGDATVARPAGETDMSAVRAARSARAASIGSLLVVMGVWGSTFAVTRATLGVVPPLLLAFLRMAAAAACLLLLVRARGGAGTIPRPLPLRTPALMGLSGVACYFTAFNLALAYTTAADGALVFGAIPAVTTVLAALFLGERLTRVRGLGLAVAALGVALLLLGGQEAGGRVIPLNRPLGVTLMLGAALAWSIYTTLGRRLRGLPAVAVTAYSALFGAALLAPGALYDLLTRPPQGLSLGSWLAIAYLGVVSSALTVVLYNRALQTLAAGQVAVFMNLVPLVGVIVAALFLGETPGPLQVLGGLCVLGGVWRSSRGPSANTTTAAPLVSAPDVTRERG